jgi:creatinine amidohydrolase
MAALFWSEMTREEISQAIGNAVMVLPTAATEQHGPHLPTGHDTFTVTEVARRAAERASAQVPVIVLPAVPFGSSTHHVPFGGTLTLQSETYFSVIRQLVISVLDAGGSKILILNGHGGNHEINQIVARDVVLEWQSMGLAVTIAAGSYWEIACASLVAMPGMANVRLPGHAGQFETSTMLAQEPGRVRTPIAPRMEDPAHDFGVAGVRLETGFAWQEYDGFTDFPHLASAELGRQALDAIERDVARAIVALGESGESQSRRKGFRRSARAQAGE